MDEPETVIYHQAFVNYLTRKNVMKWHHHLGHNIHTTYMNLPFYHSAFKRLATDYHRNQLFNVMRLIHMR
jgi:hypothetical protein